MTRRPALPLMVKFYLIGVYMKKIYILIFLLSIIICILLCLMYINRNNTTKNFLSKNIDTIYIYKLGEMKSINSTDKNTILKFKNSLNLTEINDSENNLEGNIYSIKIVNKPSSKIAYQTLIIFSNKIYITSCDSKNNVLSSKWYVSKNNIIDFFNNFYSSIKN